MRMAGIYITFGFLLFYLVLDASRGEQKKQLKDVPDEVRRKMLDSRSRSEHIRACTAAQRDFLLSRIRKNRG